MLPLEIKHFAEQYNDHMQIHRLYSMKKRVKISFSSMKIRVRFLFFNPFDSLVPITVFPSSGGGSKREGSLCFCLY